MSTQHLMKIRHQAFALNEKDRADLAHDLLDSLEEPLTDIDREWIEEARRRLAEYDAGKTRAIPVEEVLRDIDERLL